LNDTRPWWLWPNVLALDAPVVAVAWQLLLADAAHVAVPVAAAVVLGLVVWGVYLADRALDAAGGVARSDRHRFAARHPTAQVAVGCAALAAAGALALLTLPFDYLEVGAAVAAGTAAYLVAVHAGRRLLGPGAKELSVGVVFAAGAAVPLAAAGRPVGEWLPGVVAFAGLCWLNCALIARWEEPVTAPPRWVIAAAAFATLAALGAPREVASAVFLGAAALVALHAGRAAVPVRVARVLADVALLSPLAAAVLS
jgi:hypothetical protein